MKFRRLFKKAAATLMAAVTALSVLPATTAFAAGDIGTISFAHTYDSSGNAMRYNSSAVFDGYTAGGTGEYKELSARNCGKRFTQSVWQQELNSHPKSVRIGHTF